MAKFARIDSLAVDLRPIRCVKVNQRSRRAAQFNDAVPSRDLWVAEDNIGTSSTY
jgi:hypothetical protein